MVGVSGPFTMDIKSWDLITQVPPTPVCTASGPGVYTITPLDTSTIFFNVIPTNPPTTFSKTYMSTTLADNLVNSSSAVNPHVIYSGNLIPGSH